MVLCCGIFISCQDHNDIVLKYGDAYFKDLDFAKNIYNSIDSNLNSDYPIKNEEYFQKALENLDLYECRLDAAEFRFLYYTDNSFREVVDYALKELGFYPYVGKYHTYVVDSKPPKRKYLGFAEFDHQSTYFERLGLGGI